MIFIICILIVTVALFGTSFVYQEYSDGRKILQLLSGLGVGIALFWLGIGVILIGAALPDSAYDQIEESRYELCPLEGESIYLQYAKDSSTRVVLVKYMVDNVPHYQIKNPDSVQFIPLDSDTPYIITYDYKIKKEGAWYIFFSAILKNKATYISINPNQMSITNAVLNF